MAFASGMICGAGGGARWRRSPALCAVEQVPVSYGSPAGNRGNLVAESVNLQWANGKVALQDVSFEVPPGEFCMVVGPNGCGKSTLLRVARGLVYPDSGRIFASEPIGFVFQDPSAQMLFPTVYMEVLSATDDNLSIEERIELARQCMIRVGIMDIAKKPTLQLSGGQKQRVATATMLVRRPRTMLFDEVTASLDPESKASVLQFVKGIVKDMDIACLWVTHVYEELEHADRVIVMEHGRIIADGTYDAVKYDIEAMWDKNPDDW